MIPDKLQDFDLIWRWTQESHTVFSEEELEELNPLSPALASQLVQIEFESDRIEEYDTSSIEESGVQLWLESKHASDKVVYLVWDYETALSLPWNLFARYWSDFCYSSSDEVSIFSINHALLMQWRHFEVFRFGRETH